MVNMNKKTAQRYINQCGLVSKLTTQYHRLVAELIGLQKIKKNREDYGDFKKTIAKVTRKICVIKKDMKSAQRALAYDKISNTAPMGDPSITKMINRGVMVFNKRIHHQNFIQENY